MTIYKNISKVANLLHNRGWAEKNAGNFSIKIDTKSNDQNEIGISLPSTYKYLSNCTFIISGKGKRMRDTVDDARSNTVVIRINNSGDKYFIFDDSQVEPTSELPAHLAIHNMIAERGGAETVVMHSHVTELIALTQIREFCDENKLNKLLFGMHPEIMMFIPDGVGFVPYETPGTIEIAEKTVEKLKKHQLALWEKHGVFSIADSIDNCFDLIDIAAKAAKIFFLCSSSGYKPEGLNDKQLDKIKN